MAVTFVGVIVHEWAHKMACKIFGVRVLEVKYFSPQGGYVRHEKTNNLTANICISLAPLIVNSLVAFALGWVFVAFDYKIVKIIVGYLAISIGMHAFPSAPDVKSISDLCVELKKKKMLLVAKLMEGLFGLLRLLSIFWLDVAYGIFLLMAPTLLLQNFSPSFQQHRIVVKNVELFMQQSYQASRLIKASYPDGVYGEELLSDRFYFNPGDAEEREVLSPYGKRHVADYDDNDKTFFWIYSTDVPQADCEYIMSKTWKQGVPLIYESEVCMPTNHIGIRYK